MPAMTDPHPDGIDSASAAVAPRVQTSDFTVTAPGKGSSVARAILRWSGWKVDYPGGMPAGQGLMLIAPHTSNWDVPWGVLYKWALGLPLNFWAKHTLFETPVLGSILRFAGGLPVNRKNPVGLVEQMSDSIVAARKDGQFLWLVITPEGTRKATDQWRNGFYRMALRTGCPVALAYIDYSSREIGFDRAVYFSGDLQADIACVAEAYAKREGKIPSGKAPVRWRA